MARANIKKKSNVEFKEESIKEIKLKEEQHKTKWSRITLIGLWIGMGIAGATAITVAIIALISFFQKTPEVEDKFKEYFNINSSQLSYLIGKQETTDQYGTFESFLDSSIDENILIYNVLTKSDAIDIIYIYFYKDSVKDDDPYLNDILGDDKYKNVPFFFYDLENDPSIGETYSYISFPDKDYFLLIFNVDNSNFTTVPVMEFKAFSQKNQINTLLKRFFELIENKGE
jgi:hypothetical protein